MVEDSPFVSCIMPTADRPQFIRRSIKMFLDQSYRHKELIILDDGAKPVRDLVPKSDQIRYFKLPKQTMGQKRNTLCNMAHGDIIVHWDDDDFQAPWRIDMQVRALKTTEAGITGLNNVYYRDEANGNGWLYTWPKDRGPWLLGATFAYWKSYWKKILFPHFQYAEDLVFIFCSMAQPVPPHVMHSNRWFVGSRHETNISGKLVGTNNWEKTKLPTWVTDFIERERVNGQHEKGI